MKTFNITRGNFKKTFVNILPACLRERKLPVGVKQPVSTMLIYTEALAKSAKLKTIFDRRCI